MKEIFFTLYFIASGVLVYFLAVRLFGKAHVHRTLREILYTIIGVPKFYKQRWLLYQKLGIRPKEIPKFRDYAEFTPEELVEIVGKRLTKKDIPVSMLDWHNGILHAVASRLAFHPGDCMETSGNMMEMLVELAQPLEEELDELREYMDFYIDLATGTSLIPVSAPIVTIYRERPEISLLVKARQNSSEYVNWDSIIDRKDYPELPNVPATGLLPYEDFFSHCWVLGATGQGKSQLLSEIINALIDRDVSIVVVDSQSDLINSIASIASIQSRLIHISPRHANPAINLFDISHADKNQVLSSAIQTIEQFFQFHDVEITGKQGVGLRYIIRLLFEFPEAYGRNATFLDLLDVLDNPGQFDKAVSRLSEVQRRFFRNDLVGREFKATLDQLRYRVMAIISDPTVEKLLTQPKTELNLFDRLNNGAILLVDTAKDYQPHSFMNYGRVYISLVFRAIIERATTKKRKDTFMLIDECHEYMGNSSIEDFLTQARKFRCGMILAHHSLSQAEPRLRAALMTNPAIRAVSGISTADAKVLASDMDCRPEDLTDLPSLTFRVGRRGKRSFEHHVTPGLLGKRPQGRRKPPPKDPPPEDDIIDVEWEEVYEEKPNILKAIEDKLKGDPTRPGKGRKR